MKGINTSKSRKSSTYNVQKFAKAAKAESSEKKSSKSSKKSQKSSSSRSFSFWNFLSGSKMIVFYGLLLMVFSFLLLISIISFYANSGNNIAIVEDSLPHSENNNWLGLFGTFLSYFFVQHTFGVSAIIFVALFFIYSVRIVFKKSLSENLLLTTINSVISMAWVSYAIGIFSYSSEKKFLAGDFGNFAGDLMVSKTGMFGAIVIAIFLLLLILIFCYNLLDENSFKRIYENISEKIRANRVKRREKREKSIKNIKHSKVEREELGDIYSSEQQVFSAGEYKTKTHQLYNDDDEKSNTLEKVSAEPDTEEIPFTVVANPNPQSAETQEDESDEILPFDEDENAENVEDTQHRSLTPEEVKELEPYDPRKDLSHFEFPPIELLVDHPYTASKAELMNRELRENSDRIKKTLLSFGIDIKSISAVVGPTVTLYEIVPKEGVKISKIKGLEDDIALSLAALGIRIIAPIPGRGTIGIEVPNKNPNIVSMREIITSEKFKKNSYALPIGLGKTINNESFVVDLAKMPHLLVAGATGQGKSVGLNAIITSLLYTKHPSEMKFVLIDPKKVEFTLYSAIENYYLATLPENGEAIITDTKKVVRTLNSLCVEMDQRYDLLKTAKMRNIKEYNAKFCARELSPAFGHRYLPYIVVVIDEFGDLIITAGREVETPLARLAQLARAIGIHLVIATQRPSVNIITGSIKANFPARIAFRVQSGVDSKTILDATGANQLIGKGDMLISTGSDLVRLQCAFVDTPEVEKIAEFIEKQAIERPLLEPYELPDIPEPTDDGSKGDTSLKSDELDPLLIEAATLIVQTQQGSTSSIQRKMSIGYNRAGRIMDQLEDLKIVGPGSGSKPRQVLFKTEAELRQHLASLELL